MLKALGTYIDKLKYSKEMQQLIVNHGKGLNTLVNEIASHCVYRYVYKNDIYSSHIPPYIKKPNRTLPGRRRKIEIEGYGLSCLETFDSALFFWEELKKNYSNLKQSVGDCLAQGTIDRTDGVIDIADQYHHFNLYEFDCCDLGSKFVVIKQLV